ncbi:YdcF family protein [Rhodococcus sp. IEGM 1379]|uniref:YdcF family protein n=1 Tax=Rhodococcus sp. IEGM 1379 TaxID=3047086 RepID=UPI0024B64B9F|nr:YdcF family protein [Rhodococcus sp. IEGM 1379]MDI9917082.1 YdcF family protein [Rhodococcus sp. IEGM 1379]
MSKVSKAAAVSLSVLAMTAIAGWPVYVAPKLDEPHAADAVVVLGGAHDGREEVGLDLMRRGYAPRIVFSNPYGNNDKKMRSICDGSFDFPVDCFIPSPSTTEGEGFEIERLARLHDWNTVIVVTFVPHISRARYIISRCYSGELLMVASRPELSLRTWAFNYVYQTAGYLRNLRAGC